MIARVALAIILTSSMLGCREPNTSDSTTSPQATATLDDDAWKLSRTTSPMDGETVSALYTEAFVPNLRLETGLFCVVSEQRVGAFFSIASDENPDAEQPGFTHVPFTFGSRILHTIPGRVKLADAPPLEIWRMEPLAAPTNYRNVATLGVELLKAAGRKTTGNEVGAVQSIRMHLPIVVELRSDVGPATFTIPAGNASIETVLEACDHESPAASAGGELLEGQYVREGDDDNASAELEVSAVAGGKFRIVGAASLGARTGDLEAEGELRQGRAHVVTEFGCSLDLSVDQGALTVANSQGCGGMGVTFDGRYQPVR